MSTLEYGKKIAAMLANAIGKVAQVKEVEKIDSKIAELQAKKAALKGNSTLHNVATKVEKKSKAQVSGNALLINVAMNVQVKAIRRNIETVLGRNLSEKDANDFQLLYDHLHYYYSVKHADTLPIVHGKNRDYHIDDYARLRTNSVINDDTAKKLFT